MEPENLPKTLRMDRTPLSITPFSQTIKTKPTILRVAIIMQVEIYSLPIQATTIIITQPQQALEIQEAFFRIPQATTQLEIHQTLRAHQWETFSLKTIMELPTPKPKNPSNPTIY